MKTLNDFFNIVFLITGTIIGAGFITGAELIVFFGTENFLLSVIITTILIAVVLLITFKTIKRKENDEHALKRLLGGNRFYNVSTCFTSLVFTSSMLAGIDALFNTVTNLGGFQIASLIVIFLISLFSKFGAKGIEKLNFVLMPLIIFAVNFLIIVKGKKLVCSAIALSPSSITKAFLYVYINIFVALPIMKETSKNKSIKTLTIASIVVALVVGAQAYIILSVVAEGGGKLSVDMPLYFALFNGCFSLIFFLAIIFACLTSAFSAYYPLYCFAKKKGGNFGVAIVSLVTVVISKLGLNKLISIAYPIIGGLGVLFFVRCLTSIKRNDIADNKANQIYNRGKIMSKKKKSKNKVIKLTDEEYSAYIMALKDERPPKIVRETQEK